MLSNAFAVRFAPTADFRIATDFGWRPFIPVTDDQIEGGVKHLPPGMNLVISIAGFKIRHENDLTANSSIRAS